MLEAPPLQICQRCGGSAPVDVHFCSRCGTILSLASRPDYFEFLGVPRRLNLDRAELERKFRVLSRQFHPDYFHKASPAERRASLERSSYLNDAYRTLRQPIARIEYLLDIEGLGGALLRRHSSREAASGSAEAPEALLEQVFALNEELDAVRHLRSAGAAVESWRTRLEQARRPIDVKRIEHEQQLVSLSAEWDALVDRGATGSDRRRILTALRNCLVERNYILQMLDAVEKELTA